MYGYAIGGAPHEVTAIDTKTGQIAITPPAVSGANRAKTHNELVTAINTHSITGYQLGSIRLATTGVGIIKDSPEYAALFGLPQNKLPQEKISIPPINDYRRISPSPLPKGILIRSPLPVVKSPITRYIFPKLHIPIVREPTMPVEPLPTRTIPVELPKQEPTGDYIIPTQAYHGYTGILGAIVNIIGVWR